MRAHVQHKTTPRYHRLYVCLPQPFLTSVYRHVGEGWEAELHNLHQAYTTRTDTHLHAHAHTEAKVTQGNALNAVVGFR